MERYWRPALVAAVLFTGLSAATKSPPAPTDFERDVIARLDRIERLVGAGSGGVADAVHTVADFACFPGGDCNAKAEQLCAQSGFAHGVTSRAVPSGSSAGTHRATEVTCF